MMQTDIILKNKGMKILIEHFGIVDAQKFISIMKKEKAEKKVSK
jgi:hypothetical protein